MFVAFSVIVEKILRECQMMLGHTYMERGRDIVFGKRFHSDS
jgi:hypothetical protein